MLAGPMQYWPLCSIALVALGFAMRWNTVGVVVAAGLLGGVLAGMSPDAILALLGESFAGNRALLLFVLVLPAIGLLERAGLREHARASIARLRGLTLARLLIGYLALRQISSMLGLTHVAGHAQTVRPLLAPMSEAAAGATTREEVQRVRALAAATDNVGLFFGEDVFVAIGAVLLVQAFFAEHDLPLDPLDIARWAAPTALAAFVVHGAWIVVVQRRIARRRAARAAADE
jgi:uncharacterized membrane protein